MLIQKQRILPKNLSYRNHVPVLLQEVCHYLDIKPGGKYVDATFGGGGHSRAVLERGGHVLGLDQDAEAVAASVETNNLEVVKANFTHLPEVIAAKNWLPIQGMIFDLGVSSHQFDAPERGFSLQRSGPLDMRMDQSLSHTAATLVNEFPAEQLTVLLQDLGELPVAKTMAQRIVAARPITTTDQLAVIAGKWARQVFQALRIAVNDELGALQQTLPQALELLAPGGRIVVISFHSLEDRIIKQFFKEWEERNLGQALTPKPIAPTPEEIAANPRAKSAKLRVFQKL